MQDYWNYHDEQMKKLKNIYQRISKQTQNKLQEIFDIFGFTSDNLYDIVDNNTKRRINTYIERMERTRIIKK